MLKSEINQMFETIIEAFKSRDIKTMQITEELKEVITELQQETLKQQKQIKDLQDTVTDLVLLTGSTESN